MQTFQSLPRLVLLRLGLLCASAVMATAATGTPATVRQERRTVSLAACDRVIVDGLGHVSVVGTAASIITVTATLHGFSRDEDRARQYLGRIRWFAEASGPDTVRVGVDPRGLKAMLRPGDDGADGVRVDLRLEVPRRAMASIVTAIGDVAVSGTAGVDTTVTAGATTVCNIAGHVYLKTQQGRIDCQAIRGNASLETRIGGATVKLVGGSVRISTSGGAVAVADCPGSVTVANQQGRVDVRRSGNLTVRAQSSSILAEDLRGSADLTTHNGRISVHRLAGENLTAKTETGAIEVTQPHPSKTRYDLQTRNGRIDILLSPLASQAVDLVSLLGRVQCRMALAEASRDASGHRLSGTLGAGTYRLKARSQTGAVRLLPAM
jgi:DUF4097 and DUF4098 domain-containing protein YvlB